MKKTFALKILDNNSLSSLVFKHKKCSCLLKEKGNKIVVKKRMKNLKFKDNEQRKIIRKNKNV